MLHHGLKEGHLLLDKYRVERVIGAGGMGVVVAARHIGLDELVAIKLMRGEGSPADVGRFVREARACAKLRSQHAARVLDVASLDDGTPYMVLEYLDGEDLARVLRERGPLPSRDAVDIVLQACEAIAEAHAIGIIHRDLKPANLFLTASADGAACVKVLDFGIAKWANAGTQKMDLSQPVGSAPYMAPEQIAEPERVDARTDVWALGATLFHLLTGSAPFGYEGADSVHALMHAVLHRSPLRPRALRPDLPEELEAILAWCLEKRMDDRCPNVAELSAALVPFGGEQALARSRRIAKILGAPTSSARAAAGGGGPAEAAPPAARARRVLALALSAATAVLVVTAALVTLPGQPGRASAPPPVAEPAPPPTLPTADVEAARGASNPTTTPERAPVPSSARAAAPQRSVLPARRISAPAPPTGTPSSTSAPKEDLYGRRR
jgi:eukaryotic-like serine/threonine-protein kinase